MRFLAGLALVAGLVGACVRAADVVETDAIRELSPERAAELVAAHAGGDLDLSGLRTLSPETAGALAAFRGSTLFLDGLATLGPEAAAALAKVGAGLSLGGLDSLSPEAARALADFEGIQLNLEGLSSLSPETAAALGKNPCQVIFLNGVETLDPEAAAALATFRGQALVLDGLTAMTPEVATGLAVFKGENLHLTGLTSLTPESAHALAGCACGNLLLEGVKSLSPEAAAALAGFRGNCQCRPLRDLVTRIASQSKSLTVTSATLLARSGSPEGVVVLPGITAFDAIDSVEIAAILATAKSSLVFPNLTRISPRTFSALVRKDDVLLPNVDTLEIIAEPDGSRGIADDFVLPDGFEKRQELLRATLRLSGD